MNYQPSIAVDEDTRPDRHTTGEQRLFQMVIVHAVKEALGHIRENSRAAKQARKWILSDADFEVACDLAGWDADLIRIRVTEFIQEGKVSNLIDPLTGRPRNRKQNPAAQTVH